MWSYVHITRHGNQCSTEVPECDSLVAILAIPIGIELHALFLYIALRIHTSR